MNPIGGTARTEVAGTLLSLLAALTFAVAAVSFATSYGALYAYARDTGLYSDRLTRIWPLLLDGAFIVAQLAAILAGILRGSRGWPILTMPSSQVAYRCWSSRGGRSGNSSTASSLLFELKSISTVSGTSWL